ncbi:sarcosine oxidase subunit beta family protein [Paracoccus seriniphilus]|uniref:Sarcosine oxidase subunit beta n=1 Tax=Paracoccus seriniphilus TaxID=184748 RepID=A0A239PZK2_9RHOB|nr:sarcosine oxidase subunit beta family protein [Paracoccus seriniphilus]WCR15719.1 sarcosine oxidase subunit beta family protein [Paracoccus seriniphilus]SNT75600.1 sarcosine oxidase subunit beta [Paracoccus seriniphilus]
MNYNVFNLLWQGLSGHKGWQQAWRSPEPKPRYDAVIIGGGGHGLATAYYLAREYGMTNIALLEKGWLGGGNTGRNTTNVRSDYMFPESAAIYDMALRLYETLGKDLNYNIMLSQRGWLTLIEDQHQMEGARHKANWLQCNGVDGEIIGAAQVAQMMPGLQMKGRYPVRGAFLQKRGGTIRHDAVAWGYARAADRLGVDIIQNCEVQGFEQENGRITAINTSRGRIETDRVGVAVAGHSGVIAEKAGFRLPITSHCLQAMVSEPVRPFLDHVVISPGTGVYINQTQKGEMVMGGVLDLYHSYGQRGNFPTIEKVITSAVEMFPAFSQMRLMRHWAGIVDISPDSSPILGQTPVENMYINCGWGTGGFKAIPAGGYMLAHSIATGRPHELAAPFGLNRFRDNRLVDEGAAAGIAH